MTITRSYVTVEEVRKFIRTYKEEKGTLPGIKECVIATNCSWNTAGTALKVERG